MDNVGGTVKGFFDISKIAGNVFQQSQLLLIPGMKKHSHSIRQAIELELRSLYRAMSDDQSTTSLKDQMRDAINFFGEHNLTNAILTATHYEQASESAEIPRSVLLNILAPLAIQADNDTQEHASVFDDEAYRVSKWLEMMVLMHGVLRKSQDEETLNHFDDVFNKPLDLRGAEESTEEEFQDWKKSRDVFFSTQFALLFPSWGAVGIRSAQGVLSHIELLDYVKHSPQGEQTIIEKEYIALKAELFQEASQITHFLSPENTANDNGGKAEPSQ